jgi:superfamily I DNA/RNA helicase/mRNA-degrading endonuclease RelE of RelBE toxin-antitoxin system
MSHILSMKEGFLAEWLALPAKEQAQIGAKLKVLTGDPRPDGGTKKQLKYLNRKVNRIRSGDYRVFYTFDDRYVSVLKVERRSEDTYDGDLDAEYLGGPEELAHGEEAAPRPVARQHAAIPAVDTARTLPIKIDSDFLNRLHVPAQFHARLKTVETEDDLLSCEGVPDDLLLRIDQAVYERPLDVALDERELVTDDVDDLFKYRDGDLMAFLLRLSAEQEKYVLWALEGGGPTLVKGGPGTGKSTVALYRVRSMLTALKAAGNSSPRVLFTTYTNALVTFSEQLLKSLLGADAALVEVRTADSLAISIVSSGAGPVRIATLVELRQAMQKAIQSLQLTGSSLTKRAGTAWLGKLGPDYLIDEVGGVIEARRIRTLDAYLSARRHGRKVPLTEAQRTQIWALRDAFNQELSRLGRTTFHLVRAEAARIVEEGNGPSQYDGVVVDEAQDLDPSLLWILVSLAKAPNRVFLTADADQSIYGGGFRWADVHDSLKFRGRTGVLRANFRSTREIGEAARAYIADGALEEDAPLPEYVHAGPLPTIRHVSATGDRERALLIRFYRDAAREFRLPVWAGALLVPSEKAGQRLAADLQANGLPARFMGGRDLELNAQVVKVVTLKSAKGLEFPFVALAGFENPFPFIKPGTSDEERQERSAQERRTLFVGMTRAMRALLISIPDNVSSSLLAGFDEALWNIAHA